MRRSSLASPQGSRRYAVWVGSCAAIVLLATALRHTGCRRPLARAMEVSAVYRDVDGTAIDAGGLPADLGASPDDRLLDVSVVSTDRSEQATLFVVDRKGDALRPPAQFERR